ncbi:MAG: tRNA 2-selenouridine(34) synthase MnmH [Verrucomicrobiales bacterium]|nr:tRNA 2-selenouridine(34) synthase MnmH [Verrucomicrobiales bacterium]
MSRHIEIISLPADLSGFQEIVDVRSPGEFEEDHLDGAINLPVLSDEERVKVGTIYKQVSAFDARKLGAAIVSRNIANHLDSHFASKPKDYRVLVYCWRGGQRSGSMATVLSDVGWDVSLICGGYKAYRSTVVESIKVKSPQLKLIVLNGYTGAGKTLLLAELNRMGEQVLDLEGIARHKGSVFGGDPDDPQPAQKQFESLIFKKFESIDMNRPLYIEAESAKIGKLNLPNPLWQKLKGSPVIEIDSPVEARARYLSGDYEEWVGNLDRVHDTIDRLAGFHANKTLARWKTMTEAGEWHPFVVELLTEHYDHRYTVDGSGNYQVPSATVQLLSHDSIAIKEAAEQIRRLAPSLLL